MHALALIHLIHLNEIIHKNYWKVALNLTNLKLELNHLVKLVEDVKLLESHQFVLKNNYKVA